MKKVQKLPVVLSMVLVILSILFVGCFRSISPIYTDKDIIFDPALFGIYQDPNYSNNYTLIEQDSDPRFYRITLKEDNYEFLLRGTLVKFGGVEFLDVEPLERLAHQIPGVVGGVDVAKDFVWQPVHTFFKIVAKTPDLKLAMMDEKGLFIFKRKTRTH